MAPYNLDIDEVRVKIVAQQGSVEHEVVHVLRVPESDEVKEFLRRQSKSTVRGSKVKVETDTVGAAEWLWGKLVQSIEGYSFGGKAATITTVSPDWPRVAAKIPPTHKQRAVESVMGTADISEDDEKNS